MAGIVDLPTLLSRLDPVLHPERLTFALVPAGEAAPPGFARVEEDEGTTVVLPEADAVRLGLAHEVACRRIELRVRSDLAAVGLTAAVAGALAAEGISANVVAAFHHDHVLVPADDAERARDVLLDLTGPPRLRPATAGDEDDLWPFVGWAADATADEDARTVPGLQRYVAGFGGRPGDVGVVAVGPSGRLVGAAWARLLVGDEQDDECFVDAATPEVAIATAPSQRGRGLGDVLLAALVDASAAAGHHALMLTVREGKPAVRLYRRHGFEILGTVTNRVGGRSVHMVRRS